MNMTPFFTSHQINQPILTRSALANVGLLSMLKFKQVGINFLDLKMGDSQRKVL